jgi:uncharacterized membrane protein
MAHPAWARRFLGDDDAFDAIARAIGAAEARTSAEIRVHLERRVPRWWRRPDDALGRAQAVFQRLGMARTAERNGILIYLAVDDHALAVVGDAGIHAHVGDEYWTGVCERTLASLRAGPPAQAIVDAVADVGGTLARYFPRRPDDVNELSDDVSVG